MTLQTGRLSCPIQSQFRLSMSMTSSSRVTRQPVGGRPAEKSRRTRHSPSFVDANIQIIDQSASGVIRRFLGESDEFRHWSPVQTTAGIHRGSNATCRPTLAALHRAQRLSLRRTRSVPTWGVIGPDPTQHAVSLAHRHRSATAGHLDPQVGQVPATSNAQRRGAGLPDDDAHSGEFPLPETPDVIIQRRVQSRTSR